MVDMVCVFMVCYLVNMTCNLSFFLDVKDESRVKMNVSFDECNFVSIYFNFLLFFVAYLLTCSCRVHRTY